MNRRPWSPLALLLATLLLAGIGATTKALATPLSAPVLEALLAAEFARQANAAEAAAAWALAAALAAPQPALSALALESALRAGDAARASAALARWQTIEPVAATREALALRFHVAQGDSEQAVQAALRLLANPEGVAAVAEALAAPYPDNGVIARAVLRELRIDPAFPLRIEAWLAMAGLAQRLGDGALSSQWIDDLVGRFPADPRAGLLRAERLNRQGKREAARAEVRLVLLNGALSAEQRRIAAEALAVLGDAAGAAAALARGPQDARSLGLRSSWLARAGDLEGLGRLFTEAQALATPAALAAEPALPLLLGEIAERLQDWPAAEHWYRHLGSGQGEARDRARLRLGVVLARQQRFDAALDTLRRLQADESADGAVRRDAFIAEADQFESRRRRDEAEAALGRGLAVLEDDPALRVARAGVARNAGRWAAAEADLRAVLDRDADHAGALRALGALLLGRGQPAKAEPWLARAWVIAPGAPTAAVWGESLWLLGRTADARAAWLRGKALDPADPVLVDTLERFGQ